MEEKPNYYAIIPANVRYDTTLRANEKLLYGEITSLTQKTGECWASNKYFAELYNVKENAIAVWIRHLKERNYIEIEYTYKGKEIQQRIIKIGGIQKDSGVVFKKIPRGIQKDIENNKYINNTSINNIKENIKRKVFQKPTIEEIEAYCKERNNGINANAFYDFYESKDWYVGKNKMKDWKACVRTWEQRNKKSSSVPDWFDKEIEKKKEIEITDEERRMFGIYD